MHKGKVVPKYNIKTTELFEEMRLRLKLNTYEQLPNIPGHRRNSLHRIREAIKKRHLSNKSLEAVIREEIEKNNNPFDFSFNSAFIKKTSGKIKVGRLRTIYNESLQNLTGNTQHYTENEIKKAIALNKIKKFDFDEVNFESDFISRVEKALNYCRILNDFPDEDKNNFIQQAESYLLKAIKTPCFYQDAASNTIYPFNKKYIGMLYKAVKSFSFLNVANKKTHIENELDKLHLNMLEYEFYSLLHNPNTSQRAKILAQQITEGFAIKSKDPRSRNPIPFEDEYFIPPGPVFSYKDLQENDFIHTRITKIIVGTYSNLEAQERHEKAAATFLGTNGAKKIIKRSIFILDNHYFFSVFRQDKHPGIKDHFLGQADNFIETIKQFMQYERDNLNITKKYITSIMHGSSKLFKGALYCRINLESKPTLSNVEKLTSNDVTEYVEKLLKKELNKTSPTKNNANNGKTLSP